MLTEELAGIGKTVLVVDDEEPILDAVSYALHKEGYGVIVAANAEAAMRAFHERNPDLLILDVMLPSASGFEVCRKIREVSSTPIILLTARAEEGNKVRGLELGADDYVTKPFSVKELLARVKAILRRRSEALPAPVLSISNIVLDQARHVVTVRGALVQMTPREFGLLAFFMANPDLAFSRQQLLDRVWGADAFVDERTVDVHVRWLRSKIEVDSSKPDLLLTVRGLGYKFAGER